ncbi:cysteine-rich receptor-like protein kinase 10 isoform X2 [Actinidia eriantha]|uniref:cysteine-rich receptor-like protein kinase 10 isoform X2 n=1 Tax=Actinidia eriantha TaxID=165200 RepID=UPI002583DBE5|nr:cysteine-rich receptor-like protein kinase 10 isoform X2 [Actinidia eriantha]
MPADLVLWSISGSTVVSGIQSVLSNQSPFQEITINWVCAYQKNLKGLLHSLSSNASVSKSNYFTKGNDPDRLYGLFLCYEYVGKDACEKCIKNATLDIQNLCPNSNEAVVWEELCQLRYSNKQFFGHLDITENIWKDNSKNISEPNWYSSVVNNTLHNLTRVAAFGLGMFATGEKNVTGTQSIYAVAQCTTDLSPDECHTCLETAIVNISSCSYFPRGARFLSPSCHLKYECYPFYQMEKESISTPDPNTRISQRKHWMDYAFEIGSPIVLVALIFLGSCVYYYTQSSRTKIGENRISTQEVQLHYTGDPDKDFLNQCLNGMDSINCEEFPFIDLATLNVATENFSNSNKLGQGGFGPVYKGILPDGKEVAVKRLSTKSTQGSEEFTNEVLLIHNLQHKNLVRLLGFCVDGEERLLIYEHMPNGSLDIFLFDRWKCTQLNWNRRLNIISGIARGLLYLHEDSRLKIIHRDLKPSNVLLDTDMNPKISDFGMARILGGSDHEVNTARIVGTHGYIAPEYVMEGLYSIKSDVYSFGVLSLEIITGKKNAGFHFSKCSPNLVSYAWELWNEGKGSELMDPSLINSCRVDEFLRCMNIGLLCVQQDPHDRPTMCSVVGMLRGEDFTLLRPKQPAFSAGRFTDRHEPKEISCSVNGLTFSSALAR